MLTIIQQLKRLANNADGVGEEDMLILHVVAKQLRSEYEVFNLDEPEWLTDAIKTLAREIRLRTEDRLELQLKELERQERNLETPSEKRERIKRQRQHIEERLGRKSEPTPA